MKQRENWCKARVLVHAAMGLWLVLAAHAIAGEHVQPQTAGDATILIEDLELLVKPLTREQLVVEADAWQRLVQSKARDIADAEIAVRQQSRTAAEATDLTEASQDAVEQAKTELVASLTELRAQRTALIDRMRVVLGSLERKGGETTQYDKYLVAVSGISVDVTDAGATWLTITNWLKSEEGGIRWAFNIARSLITVLFFLLLARLAGRVTERAVGRAPKMTDLMRTFVATGVRRTVFAIGLVMALAALEVNVGPVLAVIGAAGFVVAFALQSTLGNFASGIMILVYRPFDLGDVIEASGVIGKVASMNLVSTTVTTPDNKVVVVPNNAIWGNVITNITGSSTRRVDLIFGISYQDEIAKAQAILEEVVRSHPLVLAEPEPVIRVHELADSSVNFVCRPWTRTADYWTVYWDVTRKVKEEFDKRGVSIPFPQRDVHVYRETPSAGTE